MPLASLVSVVTFTGPASDVSDRLVTSLASVPSTGLAFRLG